MGLSLSSAAFGVIAFTVLVGSGLDASAQDRGRARRDTVRVVACVAHEADYVRATAPQAAAAAGPQLLLADTKSGMPSYSLTGLREADLVPYVGQRVEISGTVERARSTPVLATADGSRTGSINTEAPPAAGVTPDGAAAHEPSDALTATVKAGKVAEPVKSASDLADRVAVLPRLNATTFKRVDGTCGKPASVAAATATAVAAAPAPPTGTPQLAQPAARQQPITVRGCLARQTRTGTALTPQSEPNEPLVLTHAVVAAAQAAGGSAVPGSVPSGSGSGTVPSVAGTSGTAPVDAATLTFALDVPSGSGVPGDLRSHVGERVELVGTVVEAGGAASGPAGGRAPAAPDTAHPSAPTRQITVTGFRAVGGACN